MIAVKRVLAVGAGAVAAFLTMFDNFLPGIQPPPADIFGIRPAWGAGIASFIVLAILLAVAGLANQLPRRGWTALGIALVGAFGWHAFNYMRLHTELTYPYPDDDAAAQLYVVGSQFTNPGLRVYSSHLTRTGLEPRPGQLVAALLGDPRNVWVESSIAANEQRLTQAYLLLVMSIAAGVFALVEGMGGAPPRAADADDDPEAGGIAE